MTSTSLTSQASSIKNVERKNQCGWEWKLIKDVHKCSIMWLISIFSVFAVPLNITQIIGFTILLSPTSDRAVLLSKLVDERCRVQFLVSPIDSSVRSVPCFLRNSHKYRLGSFRKTPTEGTAPPRRPSIHLRTIGLHTTTHYEYIFSLRIPSHYEYILMHPYWSVWMPIKTL